MTIERYIQSKVYQIWGREVDKKEGRKKRGINVKEKGRKWGDKKKLKVKKNNILYTKIIKK
jgi:hypothetical protein